MRIYIYIIYIYICIDCVSNAIADAIDSKIVQRTKIIHCFFPRVLDAQQNKEREREIPFCNEHARSGKNKLSAKPAIIITKYQLLINTNYRYICMCCGH